MNVIRKLNKKKQFGMIDALIMVIITAVLFAASSSLVTYALNRKSYTDLSNNIPLQEFLEVYASLMNNYYEVINEEELAQSAINGMFEYLGDDYSTYLSEQSTTELEERLSGQYEGIGVLISQNEDGENYVVTVYDDTPASAAGIKELDVILSINGESMTGKSTSEVANSIKGSTSKEVVMVLRRDKEEITLNITLKKINTPSVTYEVKNVNNKKVGYLYIETFSLTTSSQVESALKKMESEGIESLIIDVRDNTGGYLSAAESIASLFLEKGKVIYGLEDKSGTSYVKDKTNTKREYPIVVITNKASASASEILAAALKESYGATLVGETTYGKGKVQETKTLDDGSMVKYTSSLWLTPNGDCIDKVGIGPDYKIMADSSFIPTVDSSDEKYEEQMQDYMNHLKEIYNLQLDKAIELLTK